jgi:RNase H-fold protein (predicted Holliday junction resolvase)
MHIIALDLGQRCGFAIGESGTIPRSGAVFFKRKDEDRSIALANLISWLGGKIEEKRPDLIVVERPMPLAAYANRNNSEARVKMDYGLHGIVEALCVRYALRPPQAGAYETIRKHFIGVGRVGTREETKAAVVARAKLLKYMPANSEDNDRADACAIFDWASATFAGRHTEFHLFTDPRDPNAGERGGRPARTSPGRASPSSARQA